MAEWKERVFAGVLGCALEPVFHKGRAHEGRWIARLVLFVCLGGSQPGPVTFLLRAARYGTGHVPPALTSFAKHTAEPQRLSRGTQNEFPDRLASPGRPRPAAA